MTKGSDLIVKGIDPDDKRRLKMKAAEMGVTIKDVVIQLIKEFLYGRKEN